MNAAERARAHVVVLEKRVATLEAERDAALADNAALLTIIVDTGEKLRAKRQPSALFVATSMVGDVQCKNAHPGVALLEESDNLRRMHAANVDAGERLAREFDAAGIGNPCDGALTRAKALLEDHRKTAIARSNLEEANVDLHRQLQEMERAHRTALVRARNEGLEKAAQLVYRDAVDGLWTSVEHIRALKEPEQ